jgi:hypothetical protein
MAVVASRGFPWAGELGRLSVDRVFEWYARRRTPKVSRQDDSIDYLTTTLSLLAEKEGSYLHVAPWRTDCVEP